jgi:hypothetical protein
MEKSIASEILTTIQESQFFITKAIGGLKGTCSEENWRAYAKLVASAMSDGFDTVMSPIYNEYPDLAPDWYREGVPVHHQVPHLKVSKEARQALLTAFEAAYEKVQSAASRVSQLSDPLEVARYSYGVHQTSVSLCYARVALLTAELE